MDNPSLAEFEQELEHISQELHLATFAAGGEEFRWASRIEMGEFVFWLPLDGKVALKIHSSISPTNLSGTGESIRIWSVWYEKIPLLSSGTRLSLTQYCLPGNWRQRVEVAIQTEQVLRILSGDCKHCNRPLSISRAVDNRLFAKCMLHSPVYWLPEPLP